MFKEELIKKVLESVKKEKGHKSMNSMGVSESYYNPYFMIAKCFNENELKQMTEIEINNIFRLAEFAGNVFY